MKIIVCLDDNGGMMFNDRRQSRDREVISDIIATVNGEKLYIDEYSASLFDGRQANIAIASNMPAVAGESDFCFIENKAVSSFSGLFDEITVYKWNRVYPADTLFDFDLAANGFELISTVDFEGYSHEKITKEIFKK